MYLRKGTRPLGLQTRAALPTATSEVRAQCCIPPAEKGQQWNMSPGTHLRVADWLPLLSPLGCPQPPVAGSRAVCELLRSPQGMPRPEAMQGALAKSHCHLIAGEVGRQDGVCCYCKDLH